ncbi:MAG: HaeIII family restriction endonuclease [Candidatus Micrarchaeota archaeon]
MPTASDDNGRTLEYIICKEILAHFEKCDLTERAKKDNAVDEKYYSRLSDKIRENFSKCAEITVRWLEKKIGSRKIKVILDRLPDSSGVTGDPTDIRLAFSNGRSINLSIKNNYPALKHPRLTRLPEQCGVNDSRVLAKYDLQYEGIWSKFYLEAKKSFPAAKTFEEIKNKDMEFINKKLYFPLTKLVMDFLNLNKSSAPTFFHFLTGTIPFYMVKNSAHKVEIIDFTNIPMPDHMEITRASNSTILINFDNGLTLSLRLHTASKGLFEQSVKMDTTIPKIDKLIESVFEK